MPQISYAQNAEDIVLLRVFGDRPTGFYLDIGASHPTESITTRFYNQGWSGINVEPHPLYHAELETVRPRDRNLAVAISDRKGSATFFINATALLGGLSTLDADQAGRLNASGIATEPRTVAVKTLAEICDEYVEDREMDFLKIDVEGHEGKVISSGDWARFRPRVVIVEATEPMRPTPTHQEWEPLLLKNGYHFTLFDGLNRFYVRDEDAAWIPLLSVPANVFDDYINCYLHWERTQLTASVEHLTLAHETTLATYHRDTGRLEYEKSQLSAHLSNLRERYDRPGLRTVAHCAGRWARSAGRRVIHTARAAVLPLIGG